MVLSLLTTQAYYKWFYPLPIFNVDPHHTGMDSTIECNVKTAKLMKFYGGT